MRAVLRRRTEDVRRHIAEGSAVDEPAQLVGSPNDGYTPLHAAARDGQTEIVRILIEAGADVCLADGLMKATPGHKAAYQGHAEAARILIALGELDAQGPYNGFTPLHDAVWHGHAETVSVLLEAGARPDIRSHTGATPVDLALEYGYQDVAAMLQRQAASPVSEGEPARPSDTRKLG